ncbi:MAG: M16 family metallopeptidase, partial [Pseudobdellovibrionaceae bacterium]
NQKFKLKNGLTVLLLENHKSPVVSIQMWVRTGSADEQKGQEGISHFIEHLVFKGTRKFQVGEIAKTIEGSGGELNAYTSFDQTVFYVTISKEFSDTGLEAISEMMGFPAFDEKEIDNEREVVIEEIKRGQDSPGRQASQLLFSTAYKNHPYRIPVIGYDKVIRKVTKKTLLNYFHSRYVPDNMFLVVAGDFSSPEMKKKVNSIFGEFKSYKLKRIKRKSEPKQTLPRIKAAPAVFEENFLYLAFKIPTALHKDIPAVDVLSMILGQGDSSRLVKSLRIESPLVNSVGASAYTPTDQGLFFLSATLNEKNLKEALAKIADEIVSICEKTVAAEELKKAVTILESEQLYSMETVDGLSRKAGMMEFLAKDYNHFKKYMTAIHKLKAEDITKAARKYLTTKTLTQIFMGKGANKETEKFLKQWTKDLEKRLLESQKTKIEKIKKQKIPTVSWSMQASRARPETEKIRLVSGAQLLLRQSKETPMISVRAAFMGGVRIEKEDQAGLTELISRTWTGGTRNRTENDIYKESEEMASGIGGFSGRNSLGLGMEMLQAFEKKGMDLFGDVLTESVWEPSVVEREKLMMLEQIKVKKDQPASIAGVNFAKGIFKDHPYHREMLGTEETVSKISEKDIELNKNEFFSAANLTLCVTGNFDRKFIVDQFEALTKKMPSGKKVENKFNFSGNKEEKIIFSALKKEQSHLMIGYPGLTLTDPNRYVAQVIQAILAGQGGRLFLELRDKNSLAYSVSPMRMEGIDAGYFGAYIGCSPEKVEKALSMLKQEFKKLMSSKVPKDELERAQKYLIGRHDIDLQRTSAVNASILFDDIYGIDYNEPFKIAERYRAVTSDDILHVSQKLFSAPPIISLVGPNNPL